MFCLLVCFSFDNRVILIVFHSASLKGANVSRRCVITSSTRFMPLLTPGVVNVALLNVTFQSLFQIVQTSWHSSVAWMETAEVFGWDGSLWSPAGFDLDVASHRCWSEPGLFQGHLARYNLKTSDISRFWWDFFFISRSFRMLLCWCWKHWG